MPYHHMPTSGSDKYSHLYVQVKGTLTAADQRVLTRRRLPRCIRGDGILTPYSVVPAMGLALLYNSGAASVDSLVKGASGNFLRGGSRARGKAGLTDSYETHMTLPNGNVAIITNLRLLMVQAEVFAVLEAEIDAGRRQVVSYIRHVCMAAFVVDPAWY